jgi:hypothetical protein
MARRSGRAAASSASSSATSPSSRASRSCAAASRAWVSDSAANSVTSDSANRFSAARSVPSRRSVARACRLCTPSRTRISSAEPHTPLSTAAAVAAVTASVASTTMNTSATAATTRAIRPLRSLAVPMRWCTEVAVSRTSSVSSRSCLACSVTPVFSHTSLARARSSGDSVMAAHRSAGDSACRSVAAVIRARRFSAVAAGAPISAAAASRWSRFSWSRAR